MENKNQNDLTATESIGVTEMQKKCSLCGSVFAFPKGKTDGSICTECKYEKKARKEFYTIFSIKDLRALIKRTKEEQVSAEHTKKGITTVVVRFQESEDKRFEGQLRVVRRVK